MSSSSESYKLSSEEEVEEEVDEEVVEEEEDKEETSEVEVPSNQSGDRKFFEMSELEEDELRFFNTQDKAEMNFKSDLPPLHHQPLQFGGVKDATSSAILPALPRPTTRRKDSAFTSTTRLCAELKDEKAKEVAQESDDDLEQIEQDSEEESDDSDGPCTPIDSDTIAEPRYVDLLVYISEYQPRTVKLTPRLYGPTVPHVPSLIGKFDVIGLSIGRPDGRIDPIRLGVDVLDEPKLVQTDPDLLGIRLQSLLPTSLPIRVKKLPHPRDSSLLTDWLSDMSVIQREKPPNKLFYKTRMPSLDTLMQPWPKRVLKQLELNGLPLEAGMECDLAAYAEVICGLFDIPSGVDKTEALHLLFTLYMECKTELGIIGECEMRK